LDFTTCIEHQETCYGGSVIYMVPMFQTPTSRQLLYLRRKIALQRLRESVEKEEGTIRLKEIINEEPDQR
jgi:hypothetical protein